MRRLASHYVYFRQLYRLAYIELSDDNRFVGVYPLNEEIAGTAFQDGILIPIAANNKKLLSAKLNLSLEEVRDLSPTYLSEGIESGTPIRLFLLNIATASTTELCTNHRCSNGDIQ